MNAIEDRPERDGQATAGPSGAGTQPTGGFAKRKNRGNLRKRPADDSHDTRGDEAADEVSVVKKTARATKDAPLAFSTKAQNGDKLEVFKFESSRQLQQITDQGATRMNERETAHDRDSRARREAVLRQATEGVLEDGTYKGMNDYIDYRQGFRREHTIGNEKGTGLHGPLRASTNVRMTVRFDYQPDICKDYKETGFCGYGDACKFVHDRGDYKSGWELDKEWDAREKRLQEAKWGEQESGDEGEEDDGLPFTCYICREPWEKVASPVITKCKHYFCEKCALEHNAKSSKCFVCDAPTQGIFNVANDIKRKVKQKDGKDAA